MRVQIPLFILLFLLAALSGCAGKPLGGEEARVPFHIWQHKLSISLDDVAALAVTDQTLMIRYKDGGGLSISVLDFSSEPSPEGISLKAYMEQLYGDDAPTDPALKQAKTIIKRDLVEQSKRVEGELTFYSMVYPDRSMVIVLDSNSDSRYLVIDSEERSLKPMLETITRR